MHLRYRRTCRVCGSGSLTKVIDLGLQLNQGAFISPGGEVPSLRRIPLELHRCDPTADETACGLLQTACSVPSEILYTRYWYRSGTNRTMTDHLAGIVTDVADALPPGRPRVLDVGCNDGTLLRHYPDGFDRWGVDPSNAILDCPPGLTLVRDHFPSAELTSRMGEDRFDAITTIAMFYDLEDPVSFARAVRDLLADDGVWVFEMSYMPLMLEMNSYDTICHEHLEYYSLAVIEYILRRADLKLVDVSLNSINGGSIRCYAARTAASVPRSEESDRRIQELRQHEFDLELDTDRPYRSFQDRVDAHREELTKLVKDLKRAGKSIHVYGASTKGNTILQFCGIDHSLIDVAADRNPQKHGARTLGTDIPIISEEESRAMKPDYYLVLPWHFRREFLERERATVESGVAMIFPLPQVEVIDEATLDGALAQLP